MKCPKCGYLGFETTDRCRNCQYDFSLAPFTPDQPELTLRRKTELTPDFELPPIKRQTDALSATALDLDRLFGESETSKAPVELEPISMSPPVAPEPEPAAPVNLVPELVEPEPIPIDVAPAPVEEMPLTMAATAVKDVAVPPEPVSRVEPVAPVEPVDSLPFDESPLVPPPAARTPLAVRRSTPEVPRNRPRTTRPVRIDSLNFEAPAPKLDSSAQAASETIASLMEAPALGVRIGAGLIDVVLLAAIDLAIVYLTLRVTGLQNTLADLRVLPAVPFVGFLAVLAFGYVAAFTVGGGQTIGKMILNLRVIGDDGRPVDAAGGMLRAVGCMLVPATLGLSYLPAIFTAEHRALHDRLAGTRVVQE